MRVPYADNPKLWRERAEKARVQAEDINDANSRRIYLKIADSYERMADRAEERLSRQRDQN
jgi:hypothetical protein